MDHIQEFYHEGENLQIQSFCSSFQLKNTWPTIEVS